MIVGTTVAYNWFDVYPTELWHFIIIQLTHTQCANNHYFSICSLWNSGKRCFEVRAFRQTAFRVNDVLSKWRFGQMAFGQTAFRAIVRTPNIYAKYLNSINSSRSLKNHEKCLKITLNSLKLCKIIWNSLKLIKTRYNSLNFLKTLQNFI